MLFSFRKPVQVEFGRRFLFFFGLLSNLHVSAEANLFRHFILSFWRFFKDQSMQFFDTHAHIGLIYDDAISQFKVIQQAKLAGVTRIISINNGLLDFKKQYAALKTTKGIYHAVGVSPSEVMTPGRDWFNVIQESVKLPNVVAIGETGLDYSLKKDDKDRFLRNESGNRIMKFGDKKNQIELFIAQLELAQKHSLPVIIHNREAGQDIFDILKTRIPEKGAIFHCYSEDAAFAKKCLSAGMNVYFSFAGNLTYRNARNLHETVVALPKDRILIETESPFMAPAEYQKSGKKVRSMPAYLVSTAKFLAEMLDEDLEKLSEQLWSNSCRAFNLPE